MSENEPLEAISVPIINLKSYGNHNNKGEYPADLKSFFIEKVIGKGGFSKVMQVRHKLTG